MARSAAPPPRSRRSWWRPGTATLGREGRFDLAMVDGDPVGGGEPLVVLHVVHAVLQVAVALGEVDL